ncbi:hypothetical protein Leryth_026289 [Lithospermum erythrorhizon]|nr:hypothetical protein Leryth_026289 [Lithospermum erythrorhizon]
MKPPPYLPSPLELDEEGLTKLVTSMKLGNIFSIKEKQVKLPSKSQSFSNSRRLSDFTSCQI